jgi:hypothetical protein
MNCGHEQAYCSHSRWYMSMKGHGRIISIGDNSLFVYQSAILQSYQQINLVTNQEEVGEVIINFVYETLHSSYI